VSAAVQRLRAEVQADLRAFDARAQELASLDLSPSTPDVLAHAAVALHHAFGAVEAALSRTERFLAGALPEGPDFHRALLEASALEIPEVRPAMVSQESLARLRRLLGFRHFFRHAYAVSFDAKQLEALRGDVAALREPLRRDFDRLDAFLKTLASRTP
jgi:hypothetical protein